MAPSTKCTRLFEALSGGDKEVKTLLGELYEHSPKVGEAFIEGLHDAEVDGQFILDVYNHVAQNDIESTYIELESIADTTLWSDPEEIIRQLRLEILVSKMPDDPRVQLLISAGAI